MVHGGAVLTLPRNEARALTDESGIFGGAWVRGLGESGSPVRRMEVKGFAEEAWPLL